MNSLSLPASAVAFSEPSCSDGSVSVPSKSNRTARKFSSVAKPMGGWIHFPSGPTCEPSTEPRGADVSMSSPPDSLASRSPSLANGEAQTTSATDGLTRLGSLAKYDRVTRSWRTCQVSLTQDTSGECSVTWPTSGTMRRGVCSPLLDQERHTRDEGSGWWHTPTARDWKGYTHRSGETLCNQLRAMYGGSGIPNPNWIEWLIGFPIGWTALEPLETPKFREWLREHGEPSHE